LFLGNGGVGKTQLCRPAARFVIQPKHPYHPRNPTWTDDR
jgi:ATP-dependent Clp protease ATP-binding subunit ClpA